MSDASKVLEAGLSLSPAERVQVALELLESVDAPPRASAAARWEQEIRRRVAEVESGNVELEEWSSVRARIPLSGRE